MHRHDGQHHDTPGTSPIDGHEWHATRNATWELRDVLTAAGMQRDFPYLRADLNAFGLGIVELGRISPETALRLAELLRRALAFPGELPGVADDHQSEDETEVRKE